jgi:LysR family glycine cleavage system transcriptional activator
MQTQLPPLTSLRCFEAAARRESYTLAAEELFLTPSAVSHQVRALEIIVGNRLFIRVGRKMLLTDMGAAYYEKIRGAFKEIISATQAVSESQAGSTLRINVLPHFASVWLMPRLHRFIESNKTCELQISTNRQSVIFSESNVDCDIRYGHGRWPNLCSDLLVRDVVTPLCSPSLAKKAGFKKANDIAKQTLIYGNKRTNWDIWGAQFQISAVANAKKLPCDRSNIALDAAIAGLGVALESLFLAHQAVAARQLVAPFPQHSISVEGYYLVYPKKHGEIDRFERFRSWILNLLREEQQKSDSLAMRFGLNTIDQDVAYPD